MSTLALLTYKLFSLISPVIHLTKNVLIFRKKGKVLLMISFCLHITPSVDYGIAYMSSLLNRNINLNKFVSTHHLAINLNKLVSTHLLHLQSDYRLQ